MHTCLLQESHTAYRFGTRQFCCTRHSHETPMPSHTLKRHLSEAALVVSMCRADLSISICQVKVWSLICLHQLLLGEAVLASSQLPLVHHESALSLDQPSHDLLLSSIIVDVHLQLCINAGMHHVCTPSQGQTSVIHCNMRIAPAFLMNTHFCSVLCDVHVPAACYCMSVACFLELG